MIVLLLQDGRLDGMPQTTAVKGDEVPFEVRPARALGPWGEAVERLLSEPQDPVLVQAGPCAWGMEG